MVALNTQVLSSWAIWMWVLAAAGRMVQERRTEKLWPSAGSLYSGCCLTRPCAGLNGQPTLTGDIRWHSSGIIQVYTKSTLSL